jgi:hypothetical protein
VKEAGKGSPTYETILTVYEFEYRFANAPTDLQPNQSSSD